MLSRVAHLSTRRPWRVVLAGTLFVLVAGALGGGVAENLTTGGFEDPATETARASELLDERFGAGVPNVILLVTATDGDVDSPHVAAAGQALTDELSAEPGVTGVVSYWSEGNAPPLRNHDGSRAIVVGRIDGDEDEVEHGRVAVLQVQRHAGWVGGSPGRLWVGHARSRSRSGRGGVDPTYRGPPAEAGAVRSRRARQPRRFGLSAPQ